MTYARTLIIALAISLSALLGGAAAAQTQSSTDDHSVTAATRTIVVHMSSTKTNGRPWDVMWGFEAPDPIIEINGVLFDAGCEDTFSCTFRVPVSRSFQIRVYDEDIHRNEFAGSTWCSVGRTCSTGQGARVTVY